MGRAIALILHIKKKRLSQIYLGQFFCLKSLWDRSVCYLLVILGNGSYGVEKEQKSSFLGRFFS